MYLKRTMSLALAIGVMSVFVINSTVMAQGDVVKGKVQYQQYCQACHGEQGHGDGPTASSLPHKPANIASKLSKPFSSSDSVANKVLEGEVEQGMPAWQGVLTKPDALDILAYVQSVQ